MVPVLVGDEPAAPSVEDLQLVVPGKEVAQTVNTHQLGEVGGDDLGPEDVGQTVH